MLQQRRTSWKKNWWLFLENFCNQDKKESFQYLLQVVFFSYNNQVLTSLAKFYQKIDTKQKFAKLLYFAYPYLYPYLVNARALIKPVHLPGTGTGTHLEANFKLTQTAFFSCLVAWNSKLHVSSQEMFTLHWIQA